MKPAGWSLPVLAGLAMLISDASAQHYTKYLEKIEIPTDLVAPVVSAEDSIPGSVHALVGAVPVEPAVTVEQGSPVNEEPDQGSIFSDLTAIPAAPVSPGTGIAVADTPNEDNENITEAASNKVSDRVSEETREKAGEATRIASAQPSGTDRKPLSGAIPGDPDLRPVPAQPETGQPDQDSISRQDIATASPGTRPADTAAAQPAIDSAPSLVPDPPRQEPVNEDLIISGWAAAWSNNDAEAYLDYYADDFVPADPAMNRQEWERLRRQRLKNENIRIIVSNAELASVEPQLVEVQFTQRYTSKYYRDRIIKAIKMKRTDAGWKFVSERTVEKLPFE